jgi:fatty acid desaturase
MAALDHTFELGLALTWLAVTVTIGAAVLAWLYAAVYVGGSVVAMLVALVFIGFGTVIVYGTLRLYAPTTNPIEAFRRLLSYEWENQAYYHCDHCDRSYTQPGQLTDLNCPYCGSGDQDRIAG